MKKLIEDQETLGCYLNGRAFSRVIYYLENVLIP